MSFNRQPCLTLCRATGSDEVRIHIEVVIEGHPGRKRVATVERIVGQSACDGIGLSLEEGKGLIGGAVSGAIRLTLYPVVLP